MVFAPSGSGGTSTGSDVILVLEKPVETTDYAQLLALSLSDCQHAENATTCRYGHLQNDIPASR